MTIEKAFLGRLKNEMIDLKCNAALTNDSLQVLEKYAKAYYIKSEIIKTFEERIEQGTITTDDLKKIMYFDHPLDALYREYTYLPSNSLDAVFDKVIVNIEDRIAKIKETDKLLDNIRKEKLYDISL